MASGASTDAGYNNSNNNNHRIFVATGSMSFLSRWSRAQQPKEADRSRPAGPVVKVALRNIPKRALLFPTGELF
jgi:hypothetical protein